MMQRDARVRDPAYMAWIAKLPCVPCMVRGKVTWGVHVAHLRASSPEHHKRETGKAEKPSDRWTLPICPPHHTGDVRIVPVSQHSMDELEFWESFGIDPFRLCLTLSAIYDGVLPIKVATHVSDGRQHAAIAAISKAAAAGRRAIEGDAP